MVKLNPTNIKKPPLTTRCKFHSGVGGKQSADSHKTVMSLPDTDAHRNPLSNMYQPLAQIWKTQSIPINESL
jgi:hypothetical protein